MTHDEMDLIRNDSAVARARSRDGQRLEEGRRTRFEKACMDYETSMTQRQMDRDTRSARTAQREERGVEDAGRRKLEGEVARMRASGWTEQELREIGLGGPTE